MDILKALFFTAILSVSAMLPKAEALSDNSRVPILLYHSRTINAPCDYGNNDVLSLEQDLEVLHQNGFTVVPVYWLVQWMLGWRDGSTLPDKVVGITVDDGYDADFIDRTPVPADCPPQKSVNTVLKEFYERYKDELPEQSPHASLFVIASREVRNLLDPENQHFGDNWWAAAHHSQFLEVYNHSSDHDHTVIEDKIYDHLLGAWLPASAHWDGEWKGKLRPDRTNNLESTRIHITDAAAYISKRIGVWPDLFAHPMGRYSFYAYNNYFPLYKFEHGTVAAFCTDVYGRGPWPDNYMTKKSDRWCIPRLTHGYSWRTPEEFLDILKGASYN